ncbi:hypothetical protein N9Y89_00880 [bacterium]|nr:hypothetical protein [bacterium]
MFTYSLVYCPELAFDHNQIVNEAVDFLRKEINHEVTSWWAWYFIRLGVSRLT